MTSLSEQLSAVRKSQLEAQLDFMSALTSQAFQSARQVATLNFNASRASVERSAGAFRQFLSATEPRDLFALGSHAQEQVQQMLAYSRELFSIASGARSNLQRQLEAQPMAQPQQAAPAPVAPAASAAAGANLPAEPKPIVKAVRKVAAKPAVAPDPAPLPKLKAVEASPPPVKQAALPGMKSPRKSTRK